MNRAALRLLAAASAAAMLSMPCAAAQPAGETYPQRPVRIIVNVTPGGGVDNVARIAAQHYHATWNQPFVVDNRTGAGGSIGVELDAKAAPDGYTLLVASSGIVTNAAIRPQGYDPVRDLQPITILTAAPYFVLTTPSLPVTSVKDLVALAKAKPGAVSFASSGVGSILHLSAELLAALSGTQMLHVPYQGVAGAYPAVASGDVNWVLGFPTSALPLVKAGRLKALAVTSGKRSKFFPDLPTVAESGVPDYDVRAWFGMFAPARVPPDIVAKLNVEARRAMQAPDVVRRMTLEGADIVANSPQDFAAEVRAEHAKWLGLVKRPGMKF
ncbi:MAG TPA: tripartite tricarboxylate transporter substrate binding protein [Burkholderiales bacterium]|nr:tripartite tricarboxylate transporter substrate binding protein [Burkholderiales bacterium]